tara:strand:+ start:557 stop:787 length:231 start_codon:yes stop_codon:yes gene_type:complete
MIKKGNIMKKTVTTNTFAGPIDTTFELVKHNVGNPSEHWAILFVEQDGQSLQNKWGGFTVKNTGKPAYMKKIWKEL